MTSAHSKHRILILGSLPRDRERIARLFDVPNKVERVSDVKELEAAIDRGPVDLIVYVDGQESDSRQSRAKKAALQALELSIRECLDVAKLAFASEPPSESVLTFSWHMDDREKARLLKHTLMQKEHVLGWHKLLMRSSISSKTKKQIARSTRLSLLSPSVLHKLTITDEPIIFLGKPGIDISRIAELIHNTSERRGSFLEIDLSQCDESEIPELLFGRCAEKQEQTIGAVDLAYKGTLFIDHIDLIGADLLSGLVQTINERRFRRLDGTLILPIRCALILGSIKSIAEWQAFKQLPENLQADLKSITFTIPSINEMPERIPEFADYFYRNSLIKLGKPEASLAPDILKALKQYNWTSNLDDLECVTYFLSTLPWEPTIIDLPPWIANPIKAPVKDREKTDPDLLHRSLDYFEARMMKHALYLHDNRVDLTAKTLGMPISTFKYRLARIRKKTGRQKREPN